MTFNTPAFVRIEDAEKRKELIEWAKSVGYVPLLIYGLNGDYFVSADNGRIRYSNTHCVGHDCGTNIDLFKALAAMNDENDLEQWFVREKAEKICAWFKCINTFIGSHIDGWRKATANEIIEHFKATQP